MHNFWKETCREIENYKKQYGIHRFLEWFPIHQTMFTGTQSFVYEELEELERNGWHNKIIETPFLPTELLLPKFEFTSGNTVHNAYHLYQFIKHCDLFVDINDVYEVGAGYGNLARIIINKFGIMGHYHIYDLPTITDISSYYLAYHGINNVKFYCDIKPQKVDLLIGTWSISEMPFEERDEIFEKIDAERYLIGFSSSFEDIIHNYDYFQTLIYKKKNVKWQLIDNERLNKIFSPTKVYYLFGKKI